YCLGTLQEVHQMLYVHFGLDRRYVHTVKGWFNKTLPEYKNKIGKVALLKLDADWYESVKCCLDNLWDNIVEGGYIYIDDYHLSGCQKAISEHINNKGIKPVIYPDGRGGAWFRK
ncbi:MAG: TylF/MycF/NovP-related O-methyltransferase, partial [Nanoarchaeota archaeon]